MTPLSLFKLQARFIKLILSEPTEHWPQGRPDHMHVATLAEAHGVEFLCPLCFTKNKGSIGTHWVGCWFVGKVPFWIEPGPGRWNPSGTGLADLTFVPPGATSVKLMQGCRWHGHIEKGMANGGSDGPEEPQEVPELKPGSPKISKWVNGVGWV